jgi:hypothetical protein
MKTMLKTTHQMTTHGNSGNLGTSIEENNGTTSELDACSEVLVGRTA